MFNPIENLLAFDFERKQICKVLELTTTEHDNGSVCKLNNGYVTFTKSYFPDKETQGCLLLPWTGQGDANKSPINLDDLVEDKEHIYRVTWNQQQACWWLEPVKLKQKESTKEGSFVIMTLGNQPLGSGYFNRKDLTKIGNFHTCAEKLQLNTFET